MEEENNVKIKKEQIVKLSIGICALILLVIGAAYAFFRFSSSNAFGTTNLTGRTPNEGPANVVLENINSSLSLDLEASDLTRTENDRTFWASPTGKQTTETVNNIGKFRALVDGNYSCEYTMTVRDISDDSMYQALLTMPDLDNDQMVLKINDDVFDFNNPNLFPLTYTTNVYDISQSTEQYITTALYFKNRTDKNQSVILDKDIKLEYKVTSLNCVDSSSIPSIAKFFIGDSTNPDTVNVVSKAPVYLEIASNNVEQYCISTSNKSSSCDWTNTNGSKVIKDSVDLNGNTSGNLTLYAFVKDSQGTISQVKSDSANLASGNLQFILNTGVGELYYKLGSETTYTVVKDSITLNATVGTSYSYYGLPSANYLMNECTKATPCTGNLGIEVQYRTVSATPSIGNGATYLINLANSNSTPNFISQSHPDSTVQTGTNQSTDYRYIGSSDNVENYVCLGSLQSNGQCIDEDHLYRIIGVIPTQTTKNGSYENRVKLIKSTEYLDSDKISSSYTPSGYGYFWTGQKEMGQNKYTSYTGEINVNPNNWEESTLNRVILNQTYYNSLEEKFQNMIGNSVWYLGGRSDSNTPSATMYTAERSEILCSTSNSCLNVKGTNPTYAERKIGLIYSSDYGYATSGGSTTNRNTCLTTNLYHWNGSGATDCKNNDWLFMSNGYQWTITPSVSQSLSSFALYSDGCVYYGGNGVYDHQYVVRPVFSLTSGTRVLSGTGSINSPYTLG